MMTIYKVEIEKLTLDRGLFCGWVLVGYYKTKERAEQVAKETYEHRDYMDRGKTKVTAIEVED